MMKDSVTAHEPEPFLVAITDGSYEISENDWPQASAAYRRGLEAEFEVGFEECNIGPGADLPAFITLLQTPMVPLWQLAVAGFLLGKPIKDNWEAWRDMARAVRTFFSRPAYLNRPSAAPVAVEAVADRIGGSPQSIRLLGYEVRHVTEPMDAEEMIDGVGDGPDTLYLGFVRHVFEVEADGERFRVGIAGSAVTVEPLPQR